MKTAFPLLFLAFALAAGPAAAIPRPDIPTAAAAREPDLLTPYQRRVLSLELAKLQKEIVAARREAAASDELEPLRAALAEAKLGGDGTNVTAKASALSDATETVLYRDHPEIPAKLKRLQEVGRLLEYDSRREKQFRATHPVRTAPAAPAEPPEPPAEGSAAAAEPAAADPAPEGDAPAPAGDAGNAGS